MSWWSSSVLPSPAGTTTDATTYGRAPSCRLAESSLKIGAQIRVTVRKIWISLAEGYPHAALFARVLASLETGCAT